MVRLKTSIETSHPEWLIKRWSEQFGEEEAAIMAHENNNPAAMTVRVNTAKTTMEEVIASLESEGVEVRKGEVVAECIISESGNPSST